MSLLHVAPGLSLDADYIGGGTLALLASEADIAWAAGLFEGEGCIRHAPGKRGVTRRLTLVSTDLDVLQRFVAIVGVGTIRVRARPNPAHRIQYVWQVGKWREVAPTLQAFLPYLGERRTKKAQSLLADPATRQGDVCPQGHPLKGPDAEVYVRTNGRRYCATCARDQARARRAA